MAEPETIDPLITALRMLLGDLTDNRKCAFLKQAFPGLLVVELGPQNFFSQLAREVEVGIKHSLDIADGSSPIGILGAKTLNDQLKFSWKQAGTLRAAFLR